MHKTRCLCAGGHEQIETENDGLALPRAVERNGDNASRNRILGEEDPDTAYDAGYAKCQRDEEATKGHSPREEGAIIEFRTCD